ncbi:MAG: lytic transglycosylase domain-containing protein [Spirochaetes bacterium]|nr:lytic transglycosylase domain-containing protein [Spirochaetota bacterium]
MKFYDQKMYMAIPVFAGALSSLILCIYIVTFRLAPIEYLLLPEFEVQTISLELLTGDDALEGIAEEAMAGEEAVEVISVAMPAVAPLVETPLTGSPIILTAPRNLERLLSSRAEDACDFILEKYRDIEYREWVIHFFAEIARSTEIASVILENTDRFDVPPALAFALVWEESRFNPRAINRANRNGSIDRGLFQLNNRSFPQLEVNAFFNIETNAYLGVSYLRQSLDNAGYEIGALAMYNAGGSRVRYTGTPKVTLNYVHRILENRNRIEEAFRFFIAQETEARSNAAMVVEEEQSEPSPSLRFHLARAFAAFSESNVFSD